MHFPCRSVNYTLAIVLKFIQLVCSFAFTWYQYQYHCVHVGIFTASDLYLHKYYGFSTKIR